VTALTRPRSRESVRFQNSATGPDLGSSGPLILVDEGRHARTGRRGSVLGGGQRQGGSAGAGGAGGCDAVVGVVGSRTGPGTPQRPFAEVSIR